MSHISGTATDHRDLIDQLDAFLTNQGHAWGKAFSGPSDMYGDVIDYMGTASSVAETITIEMTSATAYTVTGSVSGSLGTGTVGAPFVSSVVTFTVVAGDDPFLTGHTFTLQTSPKWVRTREAGSADASKRSGNIEFIDNMFDDTTSYARSMNGASQIEIEMHRPTEINEMLVRIDVLSMAPTGGIGLEYKDNPEDAWTSGGLGMMGLWTENYQAQIVTRSNSVGPHKYWRLTISRTQGDEMRVRYIELREVAGGTYNVAENFQIIWQAPGLDGTKEINVGAKTYGRTISDIYNIGFTCWRQTDPLEDIQTQPNAPGMKSLSLVNSPIGFWFIANGQRVIVVAKFSSLYQFAYLGFGNPYETPSVHSYPAIVGASNGYRNLRYDSETGWFRHPMEPGNGLAAFYPDGQWREHSNADDNNNDPEYIAGKVWPSSLRVPDGNGTATRSTMQSVRENLDGTRPLIPAVLIHYFEPAHMWGEFDGVYWTTGFNTVAEALIRERKFDHLVVHNIYRTSVEDYAALRLD